MRVSVRPHCFLLYTCIVSTLISSSHAGIFNLGGGLNDIIRGTRTTRQRTFLKPHRPRIAKEDLKGSSPNVFHELVLPLDHNGDILPLDSDFYRNIFTSHGNVVIEPSQLELEPVRDQTAAGEETAINKQDLLDIGESLSIPHGAAASDSELFPSSISELSSRQLTDNSIITPAPLRGGPPSGEFRSRDHHFPDMLFSSDDVADVPISLQLFADQPQKYDLPAEYSAFHRYSPNFRQHQPSYISPEVRREHQFPLTAKHHKAANSNQWTAVLTVTTTQSSDSTRKQQNTRTSAIGEFTSYLRPTASSVYSSTTAIYGANDRSSFNHRKQANTHRPKNRLRPEQTDFKSQPLSKSQNDEKQGAKDALPRVTTYRPRIGLAQRLKVRFGNSHVTKNTPQLVSSPVTRFRQISSLTENNKHNTDDEATNYENVPNTVHHDSKSHKFRTIAAQNDNYIENRRDELFHKKFVPRLHSDLRQDDKKNEVFPGKSSSSGKILPTPYNTVDENASGGFFSILDEVANGRRVFGRPHILYPGVRAKENIRSSSHSSKTMRPMGNTNSVRNLRHQAEGNDVRKTDVEDKVKKQPQKTVDNSRLNNIKGKFNTTTSKGSLSSLVEQMKQKLLSKEEENQPVTVDQYFKKIQSQMVNNLKESPAREATHSRNTVHEGSENLARNNHLYKIYNTGPINVFASERPLPDNYVSRKQSENNGVRAEHVINRNIIKQQHAVQSFTSAGSSLQVNTDNPDNNLPSDYSRNSDYHNYEKPDRLQYNSLPVERNTGANGGSNLASNIFENDVVEIASSTEKSFSSQLELFREKEKTEEAKRIYPFSEYKPFSEIQRAKNADMMTENNGFAEQDNNNNIFLHSPEERANIQPVFTSHNAYLGRRRKHHNVRYGKHSQQNAPPKAAGFNWPSFMDSASLFGRHVVTKPHSRLKRSAQHNKLNEFSTGYTGNIGKGSIYRYRSSHQRGSSSRQARLFDGPLSVPIQWNLLPTLGQQTTDKAPSARTYVPILGQHKDLTATVPYMIQDMEHGAPIDATLSEVLLDEFRELDDETHSGTPVLDRPLAQARTDLHNDLNEQYTHISSTKQDQHPRIFLNDRSTENFTNTVDHDRQVHVNVGDKTSKTIAIPYGQRLRLKLRKMENQDTNRPHSMPPAEQVRRLFESKRHSRPTRPANSTNIPVEVSIFHVDNRVQKPETKPSPLSTPRPTRAVNYAKTEPSDNTSRVFISERAANIPTTRRQSVYIKQTFDDHPRISRRPNFLNRFSNLFFTNRNTQSDRAALQQNSVGPLHRQSQHPKRSSFTSNILVGRMNAREIGDRVITQIDPPQLRRKSFTQRTH